MKVGLGRTPYDEVVVLVEVELHPGMGAFDHLQRDFHDLF